MSLNLLYRDIPLVEGANTIRVLDIEPLVRTWKSRAIYEPEFSYHQPLKGRLRIVALADKPRYAALSYVWGARSITNFRTAITCNGHDIEITRNCWDALLRIRHCFGDVPIWCDSICVDQTATAERNQQVTLMGNIYRQAQNVYLWLTPDSDATNYAWRNAHKWTTEHGIIALEHFAKCTEPEKTRLSGGDIKRIEQIEWLGTLVRNEWFERGWTFQELILAANPILLTKERVLSWETMCRAVYNVQPEFRKIINDPLRTAPSPLLEVASLVGIWNTQHSVFQEQLDVSEDHHMKMLQVTTVKDQGRPWILYFAQFMIGFVECDICEFTRFLRLPCGPWNFVLFLAICTTVSVCLIGLDGAGYHVPHELVYFRDWYFIWILLAFFHIGTGKGNVIMIMKRVVRFALRLSAPVGSCEGHTLGRILVASLFALFIISGPSSIHRLWKTTSQRARHFMDILHLSFTLSIQYHHVLTPWKTQRLIARASEQDLESWGIMRTIRTRKVTEPKDRSYAFYGVLSDFGAQLTRPDYSKSMERVMFDFISDLVRWKPVYVALLVDAGMNDASESMVPTWVPRRTDSQPACWVPDEALCNATVGANREHLRKYGFPLAKIVDESLFVCGYSLGRVTQTFHVPKRDNSLSELDYYLGLRRWLCTLPNRLDLRKLLAPVMRHPKPVGLLAKYFAPFVGPQATTHFQAWLCRAFKFSAENFKAGKWDQIQPTEESDETGSNHNVSLLRNWFSRHFHDALRDRIAVEHVLVVTSADRLGIAPMGSREGDWIFRISGVPMPMVLREKDETEKFKVVGPVMVIEDPEEKLWKHAIRQMELI